MASSSAATASSPRFLAKIFATLMMLESCSAWRGVPRVLDRRGFALQGVLGSSALLLAPSPGWARSKEKAKEKAIQKETAAEVRQAIKEYKYAPRPELTGSAETGYTFKEGTVSAGSNGELAGYFSKKGEVLRAEYKAEKARATGATSLEADKIKSTAAAKQGQGRGLTADERQINAKLEEFKGQKDEQGRVIGGLQASRNKQQGTDDVVLDEEELAIIESLKFKGKRY